MSLKLKFSILAILFISVIAANLLIQYSSAEAIAAKVKRLEDTESRKQLIAQELLSSFGLIDYSFEIAVLIGETALFENAEVDRKTFEVLISKYLSLDPEDSDSVINIRQMLEVYFQTSIKLSEKMIAADSFAVNHDESFQKEMDTLARRTSAARESLRQELTGLLTRRKEIQSASLNNITRSAEEELVLNLGLSVLVALMIIALMVTMYRAMVRPVSVLSEMTGHVSRGDYSRVHEQSMKGSGEIAALFNSFVKMTGNLEKTTVSRDYFNTIIQNSADMIFVLDRNNKIEFCNTATSLGTGFTQKQLSSMDFSEMADPLWYRKSGFPDPRQMEIICDHEETNIIDSEGNSVPVLFSCSPLLDSEGAVTSHVCIASDISDRMEAEKALQEAEYEARQRELLQKDKMETLSILVAGVAHEINNPNHVIASNTIFLKKSWDSASNIFEKFYQENGSFSLGGIPYEKAKDYIPQLLDLISGGSERIKSIVTELRDYARIEPTEITEGVSMNAVVHSASTLMTNIINKSTVDFTLSQSENLPSVWGNYQKLEQVMINLIANACQALGSGGKPLSITTDFNRERNLVIVRVEDRGKGMNDETLKHMFDPFYTTRREEGGTGLGLSISQTIIREHNGELLLSSEKNLGTVAEILLPALSE